MILAENIFGDEGFFMMMVMAIAIVRYIKPGMHHRTTGLKVCICICILIHKNIFLKLPVY